MLEHSGDKKNIEQRVNKTQPKPLNMETESETRKRALESPEQQPQDNEVKGNSNGVSENGTSENGVSENGSSVQGTSEKRIKLDTSDNIEPEETENNTQENDKNASEYTQGHAADEEVEVNENDTEKYLEDEDKVAEDVVDVQPAEESLIIEDANNGEITNAVSDSVEDAENAENTENAEIIEELEDVFNIDSTNKNPDDNETNDDDNEKNSEALEQEHDENEQKQDATAQVFPEEQNEDDKSQKSPAQDAETTPQDNQEIQESNYNDPAVDLEEQQVKSEQISVEETANEVDIAITEKFEDIESQAQVEFVETLDVKISDPDSMDLDIKEEEQEQKAIKEEILEEIKQESPTETPKIEESSVALRENPSSAALKVSVQEAPELIVVPPTKPQLFYTPLKTGLVYDVRMRYHAKIFTSYFEYIDPHPEDPRRIYRIYKKLAEAGIIQDSSLSGSEDIGPLMVKIPIREATAEEILEVHSEAHLQYIQSTESMTREQLLEETERGDSIYVNNDSFISAKLSCGGTIEACRAVVEGRVKNSLAIVRPPGHHAEPETPGGFCLFSNVAVAAKNILKQYPESVRKIVIVDWDIHHGNGTQKSFYDDPRVLYISLHRYENGRFYPGTKYGNSNQVGEGPGEGFNLNIPWRSQGMHDGDYIYTFNKVVLPVITEFDPDLMIISSGFDAADGDIIGGCHVTPSGYGTMTHMLKGIAKGKLAVILEGGYNLDSISKSALGVAKVLVGEPPENTVSQQPHLETIEVVDEVIKIQSKYWKCLQHGMPKKSFDDIYDLSNENSAFKVVSISEPIRAHQYNELSTNHQFISVPIIANFTEGEKSTSFTTELPRNLEDIVVASPNIYNAESIVLTIHDPPDVWANLNPINGVIEGSSSVVLEHPLLQIMGKIQSERESATDDSKDKVGFIDINIPSFQLPIPAGASSFSIFKQDESSNPGGSYNPTIFAQELLLYIWDNYLSYFGQLKKLVFVGFGDAYQSIVHLFGKRPSQDIKELVKGTVVFVNRSNLKSLVPVMDESMVDWYYQNSVIFTSCMNPCWQNANGTAKNGSAPGANGNSEGAIDETKKPRRKFGRVLKSSVDGLYDVINEKFDEGVDFILDSIEDESGSSS